MPSAMTPPHCKLDQPRVLIVDDEPGLRDLIGDVVKAVNARVIVATNIAEARKALLTQSIQLLIADVNLPDGNGTSLVSILQKHQPTASAIVITGAPTISTAIDAMRQGAVDFIPKPFTHQQLTDRVLSALRLQVVADKEEKRFTRLKVAVKRLNESRRLISRKVDLLCNDLVGAYGELSRQLDDVRTQESFRKFIDGAADLEQLLCHAMDWMLRQLGYCNVAVFLAADDGEFQLGAYMKYTIAGDTPLTDALKRVLLPAVNRSDILHHNASEFDTMFTPQEMGLIKGQDLLGVNCTYLGETLASLIFFRDSKSPFTADDEQLLRQVNAIFAIALASVVRDTREGDPQDGNTLEDDSPKSARKKDPADWWKTGGDSPY